MRHPTQLCRLSALKNLKLSMPPSSLPALQELVSPLRQLRELHHADSGPLRAANVGSLDAILACLPMLTSLRIGYVSPDVSEPLPAEGWAGLRRLHFGVHPGSPKDVATLFMALSRLEHLELSCDKHECREYSSYLTALSGLTHLHISSRCRSEQCPSGRIVEGLSRLCHLSLRGVLDPDRWNDDVGYISTLTRLKSFQLFP